MPSGPDPVELVVVSRFGRPEEERRTQAIYCHATCLKDRVDPLIPLDSIEVG